MAFAALLAAMPEWTAEILQECIMTAVEDPYLQHILRGAQAKVFQGTDDVLQALIQVVRAKETAPKCIRGVLGACEHRIRDLLVLRVQQDLGGEKLVKRQVFELQLSALYQRVAPQVSGVRLRDEMSRCMHSYAAVMQRHFPYLAFASKAKNFGIYRKRSSASRADAQNKIELQAVSFFEEREDDIADILSSIYTIGAEHACLEPGPS